MARAPRRMLVTGATGFVGTALCAALRARGIPYRAVVRRGKRHDHADAFEIDGLTGATAWGGAFDGVDTVVHLAARVHLTGVADQANERAYIEANVEATEALARQAAAAGVRRFVFLSSVKAAGERNVCDPSGAAVPFTEATSPGPEDAYGRSKRLAEESLERVAASTGLAVVTLRPPLVYGPGVKANFLALLKMAARGIPLPLGRVRYARSFVFVDNLVDAILCSVAANVSGAKTYFVADRVACSSAELYRMMGRAMGRSLLLLPVPLVLLRLAARIVGRPDAVDKLAAPLIVDTTRIHRELGWTAPVATADGLRKTIAWFSEAAT